MLRKSKLILLLSLCFTAICSLFLGCSQSGENDTPAVKFVNFIDETVEVEIGDFFQVGPYMSVQDTQGKDYRAKAQIKDSEGNIVRHIKYEFVVEDMEGYTIYLTVTRGETVLASRKITLVVNDTLAPAITVNSMPEYGEVGQTFTVPVVVNDADKEASLSTSMSVYYVSHVEGVEDESVAVDGFSFLPLKAGYYKIIVSSSDGKNTAQRTLPLKVKSADVAYVYEGFDDIFATQYNLNEENVWLEEFEGRTGVLGATNNHTLSANNYYHQFAFAFPKKLANVNAYMDEWQNLCFWMYIDEAGTDFSVQLYTGKKNGDKSQWTYVAENVFGKRWVEVKVSKQEIIDHYGSLDTFFEMFAQEKTVGHQSHRALFNIRTGNGQIAPDVMVYFDDFTFQVDFTASVTVEQANGGTLFESVDTTLSVDVNTQDYALVLTDRNGAVVELDNGVFKAIYGMYTATLEYTGAGYASNIVETFTVEKSVAAQISKSKALQNDTITVATVVNGEIENQIAVTAPNGESVGLTENAFVATQVGEYKVIATNLVSGTTDEKTVTVYSREFQSFTSESCTNGVVGKAQHNNIDANDAGGTWTTDDKGVSASWETSYKGVDNVLAVSFDGAGYNAFGAETTLDADLYFAKVYVPSLLTVDTILGGEWDYLAMRFYVDGVVRGNPPVFTINGQGAYEAGVWYDLQFNKATLIGLSWVQGETEEEKLAYWVNAVASGAQPIVQLGGKPFAYGVTTVYLANVSFEQNVFFKEYVDLSAENCTNGVFGTANHNNGAADGTWGTWTTDSQGVTVSLKDSFAEESNVLAVEFNGEGYNLTGGDPATEINADLYSASVYIPAASNAEAIVAAEWDYLSIRIYVDGAIRGNPPVFTINGQGSYEAGVWYDVQLTKEQLTALSWVEGETEEEKLAFWANAVANAEKPIVQLGGKPCQYGVTTIYLANVSFEKSAS